ncbi:MAG: redoxin domain-containing protein [Bacteroidia bacterium]|nr:redoxin domain-containing protein [Bacteroidia bacterium]
MKKYCFLLVCLTYTLVSFSQTDSIQAAYKRFPTFPLVNLLLKDSTTLFSKDDLPKNTSVLLMIFNPGCEHCQHETEELIKNMDSFKKIQIVMATMMPLEEMKAFIEKYKLSEYDNIIVGRDIHYVLPGFYSISNLPYLAMYDKQGKLLSTFEGTMKMEDLIKVFK